MKRIGIICALKQEIELLLKATENLQENNIGRQIYYTGQIDGHEIVTTVCGMGKVNAAIAATLLIERFEAAEVLFSGCAGSLDEEYRQGDLIISDRLAEHDVDTTFLGDPIGYISGTDTVYFHADRRMRDKLYDIALLQNLKVGLGTIVSGDQFIHTKEQKDWLVETFAGTCAEMEGAAVAHACYVLGVPFCIIRSLSDNADGSSCEDYNTFVNRAGEISAKVVIQYVKESNYVNQ